MEFRVLGRPDVYHDGERLDVGTPKQRAVLAALLLSRNETLSSASLVEAVWWEPPLAAGSNLRVYLAGLRRALHVPGERGSRLRTERAGGYSVRVLPGELDMDRFAGLAEQGERDLRQGRLKPAAENLEAALRLWRGRALDGVAYGPALQAKVTRLEEWRLAVAEQWADARLRLGQPAEVITELRVLVKEHPLRERLWGQLMVALARAGRFGEAVAAYAELRTVLTVELGVDPAPELRRLHEQILRGEELPDAQFGQLPEPSGGAASVAVRGRDAVPAGRGAAPAARPRAAGVAPAALASDGRLTSASSRGRSGATSGTVPPPRQLPAGPNTLHGRAVELARVRQLLSGSGRRRGPAVVAIHGVAGVGKSALALEVANEIADGFPDGQLYVDLQGATPGVEPLRPIEVLGRFLRTLGVRPAAVPDTEAEAAALFRSLVAQRRVLVVIDDAVSLAQVRPLLPNGPGCAALITSREALTGLVEAVRVPLGLLPPTNAVQMLAQSAGAARVAAEPEAARRVAELCGHLPIALLIAGARLAARPGWPIAALAERLEAAQDRLDELAADDLAVRSSIGLTYRGLSERSRSAFRRLGLLRTRDFPAWALAALLDVSPAEAERVLDTLVTVHLLETVVAPADLPPGRATRASMAPSGVRYRFHDLVRLFAQERAAEEDPPHVRAAATRRVVGASLALTEHAGHRLAADFLGLTRRRVARWSLPRAEVERLTADPLAWFEREHDFLVSAVADGLDQGAVRLAGCLAAALTPFFQIGNHFDEWRRVQGAALSAACGAGDRRTAMELHRSLGELDTIQDRYDDAIAHFLAAAQEASTSGDLEYDSAISAGLGYLYRLRGEYEAALCGFRRARESALATENLNGLVYATSGIGLVHLERGQVDQAVECFEECLRLSRTAGYLPGEAQALRCLGQVHRVRGDYDGAAALYERAKEISEGLGDRLGGAHAACWLGEMRVRQGRHVEGRRLIARCLWVHRDFANLWGEAGALWALAVAQMAVGRPRAAQRRAVQAVALWRRLGSPHWLAIGIETLAETHEALGEERAAELAREEVRALRERLSQA